MESLKMLSAEVERVWKERGWKSYKDAELAIGMPQSTIRRLRLGDPNVKAVTAAEFGEKVGENPEKWKLLASGLSFFPPISPSDDPLLDVAEKVPEKQEHDLLNALRFPVEVGANFERLTNHDDRPSEPISLGGPVRVMVIRHDCMRPLLGPGDVVFITPPETVESGDIVIAVVDLFSRTCKKFTYDQSTGESYLEPLNGEGRINEERFTVLGVVKYKLASLRNSNYFM
jgi:hypothetical protein